MDRGGSDKRRMRRRSRIRKKAGHRKTMGAGRHTAEQQEKE